MMIMMMMIICQTLCKCVKLICLAHKQTINQQHKMTTTPITERDYLVKIDRMMQPRFTRRKTLCGCVCGELKNFMEKMPEEYKTIKVWEKVVIKCGILLSIIPPEKMTMKMCTIAVFTNGRSFVYVPDHLKTIQMCVAAISSEYCGFSMMPHIPDHLKKDVYKTYISKYNPHISPMVKHVPDDVLGEVCVDIIKKKSRKENSFYPWLNYHPWLNDNEYYLHDGCSNKQEEYEKSNYYESCFEHLCSDLTNSELYG